MQEVPATAVAYIARQVGVPAEEFLLYWKRVNKTPTFRRLEMPRSWLSGYLSTSCRKAMLMSTSMRLPINACMIWGSSRRHRIA